MSAEKLLAIEEFKKRPCVLSKFHPDYIPPTNEEVRDVRKFLGFSQAQLGYFSGMVFNKKGCKAVVRWEADSSKKNSNSIDYAVWRLMLLAAGIKTIEDFISESESYKSLLNNSDQ